MDRLENGGQQTIPDTGTLNSWSVGSWAEIEEVVEVVWAHRP